MDNLSKVIESLKLEDFQVEEKEVSNPIEPTEDEIKVIVDALNVGKSHLEVKKEVRRVEYDGKGNILSAKGFSFEQIKEIDDARKAKFAELTEAENVEAIA
jgi:hypothetical protein